MKIFELILVKFFFSTILLFVLEILAVSEIKHDKTGLEELYKLDSVETIRISLIAVYMAVVSLYGICGALFNQGLMIYSVSIQSI